MSFLVYLKKNKPFPSEYHLWYSKPVASQFFKYISPFDPFSTVVYYNEQLRNYGSSLSCFGHQVICRNLMTIVMQIPTLIW